MKKILILSVSVSLGMLMSGCSDKPDEQTYQAQQQISAQQVAPQQVAPQQPVNNYYQDGGNSGMNDMVTGMVAGAVISNMMSGDGGGRSGGTTVIRETRVVNASEANPKTTVNSPSGMTSASPKTTASYRNKDIKSATPTSNKAQYRTKQAPQKKVMQNKATYRKSISSKPKRSSYRRSSYRRK